MHAGLVALIVIIMLMSAGVPKSSIVLEKKGLRHGNQTRPGDIVVMNFYGLGRNLVIDVVLGTVYRNERHSGSDLLHSWLCCQSAKMVEDRKFYNDKKSSHPVSSKYGAGGPCVCSLCDGGWRHIGCPCLALAPLKQLAECVVLRGSCSPNTFLNLESRLHFCDGCLDCKLLLSSMMRPG